MNAIARSRALVEDAFADPSRWAQNMAAAQTLLTGALNESPNDLVTLTCLGAVLCDQAKYGDAIDLLERAVALGSNDGHTHYNLGVARVGCALNRQAKIAFKRAQGLRASPETWTAYFDPQAQ
ncbi:hypothetical protein VLK31_18570 [Variovorax sp. H27-G14]|uniref:hypothetical protein n=1 Tax=Variovorax sp. H27-G14 TaxID=3111914 RepID=UPI0038FC77F9